MTKFGKISFYLGMVNIIVAFIPKFQFFTILFVAIGFPLGIVDIWQKKTILKNKNYKYGILGITCNGIALLIFLIFSIFIYKYKFI
jgi:hypothetical protein